MTFTASRRLRDKIREAQDLLGHQVQAGELAEIMERGLEVISMTPDRASRSAAGADARKEEGAYPSVCDRRVTQQTSLPRPRGDGSGLLRWLLNLLIEDVKKKRFAVGRKPRAGKAKRQEEQGSAPGRGQPPATKAEPKETVSALRSFVAIPACIPDRRILERGVAIEKNRRSRYIPAHVRRAVFERDGGRCTYVDERGRRCPETCRLEFDHKDGFARGAPHTVATLRLRCHQHNQWAAEQMYGRELMDEKRSGKVSEPGPSLPYGSGQQKAGLMGEDVRLGEGGRGIAKLCPTSRRLIYSGESYAPRRTMRVPAPGRTAWGSALSRTMRVPAPR